MLVNIRFQVLFHSPPGVLFTFPSQYCFSIGHRVVFRLGGWSPRLLCGFHVPTDTLDTDCRFRISSTGLSPSLVGLSNPFDYPSTYVRLSIPLSVFLQRVWPPPISLATTLGISFDFSSSAYLDVSVQQVPFVQLWIHCTIHDSSSWGFPHSEIRGSDAYFQLTAAYRRLSRPSSALGAKAFTLCSFSLEQPFA